MRERNGEARVVAPSPVECALVPLDGEAAKVNVRAEPADALERRVRPGEERKDLAREEREDVRANVGVVKLGVLEGGNVWSELLARMVILEVRANGAVVPGEGAELAELGELSAVARLRRCGSESASTSCDRESWGKHVPEVPATRLAPQSRLRSRAPRFPAPRPSLRARTRRRVRASSKRRERGV